MRFLAVGFWLVVFCLSAVGCREEEPVNYNPRTLQPIQLFMTQQDLWKQWSTPKEHLYLKVNRENYSVQAKTFPPEEYEAYVKAFGLVRDIYERKIAIQVYRIEIEYHKFQSEEQTDPQILVRQVTFFPNRSLSLRAFLNELPEAQQLCRSGCGIIAYKSEYFSSVTVYPKNPTVHQRTIASQVMRMREPEYFKKLGETADWMPVLKFDLSQGPEDKLRSVQEIEWMDRFFQFITLKIAPPLTQWTKDAEQSAREKQRVLKIGSFHPSQGIMQEGNP